MTVRIFCDACGNKTLAFVYKPQGSLQGVRVYLCKHCALLQSIRGSKKGKRLVSASSDAEWGNIRHGKGLRFQKQLGWIEKWPSWENIHRVLDIGSNRGSFAFWLKHTHPLTYITAIEPDSNIVAQYKTKVDELVVRRFEDVSLQQSSYDLAYCSHTLEHSNSAQEMLEKIHSVLKDGGWLFLEVPNIEVIREGDVVEEFFIDKHTFHFHSDVLQNMLIQNGFAFFKAFSHIDRYNITVLAQKRGKRKKQSAHSLNAVLVKRMKQEVTVYSSTLKNNRKKLIEVANHLNDFMKRQRVVIWGAGRIFDALVRYGNLNTGLLSGLVDVHLSQHLRKIRGLTISGPEILRMVQPDVVVILAHSSAEEIEEEARRYTIRHVVKFKDLMN